MKKLIPIFVACVFLFQPANNTSSQSKISTQKKKDTINTTASTVMKAQVDTKADSVTKSLAELKQIIEDKPVVKWKTRWKTKTIYKVDTLWQCPPSDSLDYTADEPDVICKTDTLIIIKRDTIKIRNKTLWQKLKGIF